MKKYLTLFTFVCVLFLGMQTASAQKTPAEIAKAKTKELAKRLELTDAQIKQVYAIYVAYENNDNKENIEMLEKVGNEIQEVLLPGQKTKFARFFGRMFNKKKKAAIEKQ